MKYKIVIADDHEFYRLGLNVSFLHKDDFELVGEAENGLELLSVVKSQNPDLAIVDIKMPVMDGIEVIKHLKKESPKTYIVVLTSFEDVVTIEKAFKAGADSYLVKDICEKEFFDALIRTLNGERVFSKSILRFINKRLYISDINESSTIYITKREQEILNLIAQCKDNNEIASELFISVRTVESHRSHIINKLGLKNTSELVSYAITNQLNKDKE